MAHLSVSLLGPFQVTLDRETVTSFESNKVRALLAYLAVEADRPHRRDSLAALLWPDWPDQAARSNLRNALANLRKAIGDRHATPSFLCITHETIQFNTASDYWLDVKVFSALLEANHPGNAGGSHLKEAVALYRGGFLEGFFLKGCPVFEDWALLVRERLHHQALAAFHRLAEYYQQCGEYERACKCARRQVELEPWQEEAHQQLMWLLALSGQRSAALVQYESCRRLLAEELGVEPAAETTRLYEQIRDGELKAVVPSRARSTRLAAEPPRFLTEEATEVEPPLFVARERELAQLDSFVDLALTGQGHVVFVTGEAGSGKTALVQEFARRTQAAHSSLVVAMGNCNAHTGVGDPYLPFREILGLLTGDVEARWVAGAINTEHARRLWKTLPHAAQSLVEHGPDLLDTFVPGTALLGRAVAYGDRGAAWLAPLQELVKRKATAPGTPSPQQSDLFEQYSRLLQALARQRPLLLVLDDLQWADSGSINLLFHLGRQLAGHRILMVGAYRPEEVALGRGGPSTLPTVAGQRERHPLEPVVNEFQREFGDIVVNVDQAEGRGFVEAFLDSEPNRLGVAFRDMLYRQTLGNPLFTIELLRGLEERGDLIQDKVGRWVEGATLDWETLPPRVVGVIAERIDRLPQAMQETLRVASVEGEVFTAEVVARVQAADEREIIRHLSGELSRQHRLVAAQSLQRVGSQRLSRYRFRHFLFQKYLYNHLDPVERAQLHEVIGNLLEAWYRERVAAGDALELGAQFPPVVEGAVELARHFQTAGVLDKAAEYRLHAGIRAHLLSANQEAVGHFNQGLDLLKTLPDSPKRAEQELTLRLALANALKSVRASTDPEVVRLHARIQELCGQVDQVPLLLLNGALWMLHFFHLSRAEYEKAVEVGKQILALAPRVADPLFIATAHWALGWVLPYLGEFASACAHLQYMIDFCERQPQGPLWFIDRENWALTLAYQSWVLWFLGYPDQALVRSKAATGLAKELNLAWTLASTAGIAGAALHLFRRESQAAQEHVERLMRVSADAGLDDLQSEGMCYRGWRQILVGQVVEGIAQLRQGLAAMHTVGTARHRTSFLAAQAEGYGKASQLDQGLKVLEEAFTFVEKTGERYYEAELHRVKGELLWMQGHEAEASFRRAIEVARRQEAKSWELRATMSLSRLLQVQGKREAARQLLAEIYSWFTEGFDTPDLKEAKALLEELS